jgi:hypothetical protein
VDFWSFGGPGLFQGSPRVQVLTEVRGRTHEVMLTEHVPAEMHRNEHYADQLVERMGWALVDAEEQEQGPASDRARSPRHVAALRKPHHVTADPGGALVGGSPEWTIRGLGRVGAQTLGNGDGGVELARRRRSPRAIRGRSAVLGDPRFGLGIHCPSAAPRSRNSPEKWSRRMKPELSGRGCILACMRIERSSARSSTASSRSLIALANGTSNSVVAPCGGGPEAGPYTGCTRPDARGGARRCKPGGELPDGPGCVRSGDDAGSRRDARLMAFIRTAPYWSRGCSRAEPTARSETTRPPSVDPLGASHHLAVLRRIDGWSRCRIGECRGHRHDAGSTHPTIAPYCEAAAMITSAWKTS